MCLRRLPTGTVPALRGVLLLERALRRAAHPQVQDAPRIHTFHSTAHIPHNLLLGHEDSVLAEFVYEQDCVRGTDICLLTGEHIQSADYSVCYYVIQASRVHIRN
jgi:hypothetical protein